MDKTFQYRGTITPEAVEEARSWIGKDIRIEQYNSEASYDTIRHYAFGLGDDFWLEEGGFFVALLLYFLGAGGWLGVEERR